MKFKTVIYLVLLGAIWGSSFLFMRFGTVEFGAVPTAALRVAIASAFLLPLLAWRKQVHVLRAHWKKIFAIGVINSGIPFLCFTFALLSITTGLSAILNATVPLFGALIAWWWLKDKPAASRILGLAIGFAGVALLAWDKASFKPGASSGWAVLACLACLVATLCYGIAGNAAKVYLSGLPSLVTATGSQIGALIALVIPALWTWPAHMPSLQAWLALVAVGVLCTGVAYAMYYKLIKEAGSERAVTVTFLVPIFAEIWGALFLGEPITWASAMGCGLVLIAVALIFEMVPGLKPRPVVKQPQLCAARQ